jgi:hypothetical protein
MSRSVTDAGTDMTEDGAEDGKYCFRGTVSILGIERGLRFGSRRTGAQHEVVRS